MIGLLAAPIRPTPKLRHIVCASGYRFAIFRQDDSSNLPRQVPRPHAGCVGEKHRVFITGRRDVRAREQEIQDSPELFLDISRLERDKRVAELERVSGSLSELVAFVLVTFQQLLRLGVRNVLVVHEVTQACFWPSVHSDEKEARPVDAAQRSNLVRVLQRSKYMGSAAKRHIAAVNSQHRTLFLPPYL